MPPATRVRRKKSVIGKKKTRRKIRKSKRGRRSRRHRGGAPEGSVARQLQTAVGVSSGPGQQLLDWFSRQHPPAVEIVKNLKTEDVVALIKCHPQLWRNRRAILTTLFRFSAPDVRSAIEAAKKSSGHTAVLCKRLPPAVAEDLMTRLENALIKTHQNAVLFDVIRNQTNYQPGKTSWRVQRLVWTAIEYRNFEALRWLIEYFNVDIKTVTEMNEHGLMAALEAGDFDTANWLQSRYNFGRNHFNDHMTELYMESEDFPHLSFEAKEWLMKNLDVHEDDFYE